MLLLFHVSVYTTSVDYLLRLDGLGAVRLLRHAGVVRRLGVLSFLVEDVGRQVVELAVSAVVCLLGRFSSAVHVGLLGIAPISD